MPPASFSEIILYNLLTSVFSFSFEKGNSINSCSLWGGRVVRLPVLGRPINLDSSRARAFCTCYWRWGCLDIFISLLSQCLWETARYRLIYCLKGLLNQNNQPTKSCSLFWRIQLFEWTLLFKEGVFSSRNTNLKVPKTIEADGILFIYFFLLLSFEDNKASCFM